MLTTLTVLAFLIVFIAIVFPVAGEVNVSPIRLLERQKRKVLTLLRHLYSRFDFGVIFEWIVVRKGKGNLRYRKVSDLVYKTNIRFFYSLETFVDRYEHRVKGRRNFSHQFDRITQQISRTGGRKLAFYPTDRKPKRTNFHKQKETGSR